MRRPVRPRRAARTGHGSKPAASRSRIAPRPGWGPDELRSAGRGPSPREMQELMRRAARVKLILLDVDGVLTDGRLWYGPEGEALKAFDVRDGHGIVLLRDHLDFGVISGRPGLATRKRLEELRFKHMVFSERDKLAGYARLGALGVEDGEVAYMGDDVNDLPLLAKVGLSACPADAMPEVREAVHFVTTARGGRGAVRELCDLVRKARGIA